MHCKSNPRSRVDGLCSCGEYLVEYANTLTDRRSTVASCIAGQLIIKCGWLLCYQHAIGPSETLYHLVLAAAPGRVDRSLVVLFEDRADSILPCFATCRMPR
ncbi:hypothetical protein KC320_g26 [Hortaea werneckii]|nr:hypothetical protein KC320_g26 [Hortaea werneckii]